MLVIVARSSNMFHSEGKVLHGELTCRRERSEGRKGTMVEQSEELMYKGMGGVSIM